MLEGQTAAAPVWDKLTAALNTYYLTESGAALPIVKFAIDSGYATPEVYAWARKYGGSRVVVIKGDSRAAALVDHPSPIDVGPQGQRVKLGIKVWPVNSSMIKEELYRWLRLDRPTDEDLESGMSFPPGYCHFPQYSEEFFKQLTAEQLITRVVKGYRKPEWQKTRDRNEALDARSYSRAAAAVYGMDRFNEAAWQALEGRLAELVFQARTGVRRPAPQAPQQREMRGRFEIPHVEKFRW